MDKHFPNPSKIVWNTVDETTNNQQEEKNVPPYIFKNLLHVAANRAILTCLKEKVIDCCKAEQATNTKEPQSANKEWKVFCEFALDYECALQKLNRIKLQLNNNEISPLHYTHVLDTALASLDNAAKAIREYYKNTPSVQNRMLLAYQESKLYKDTEKLPHSGERHPDIAEVKLRYIFVNPLARLAKICILAYIIVWLALLIDADKSRLIIWITPATWCFCYYLTRHQFYNKTVRQLQRVFQLCMIMVGWSSFTSMCHINGDELALVVHAFAIMSALGFIVMYHMCSPTVEETVESLIKHF